MPSQPRQGLSLFEAVVAIAIVGMTAVGALESVAAGLRSAARSKRAIEAHALASSRLEIMDLLSDLELQALPDTIESGAFPAPLGDYTWKATGQPMNEQPGVFEVRVTVAWPEGSYTLTTCLYRQPPLVTRR